MFLRNNVKKFFPQMNANARKYFLLVRLRRTNTVNAFAFICVYLRSFADNMLFCIKKCSITFPGKS